MNICYISNEYPPNIIGGVGIYIREISQAISELGHNIFVITQAQDDKHREYNDGKVKIFEVPFRHIGFFSFLRNSLPKTIERLEYGFWTSQKLNQIIKKYHIDIVESPESWMGGFWYYLFENKPLLLIKLHTPEGIIFKWNGGANTRDIQFINRLEKFWMTKANLLIGVTKAITELVSNYYALNINSYLVISNPLDFDLFKEIKKTEFKNHELNVLYTGRLEFRKGIHILIRAIPKVLQEVPEAKFIFIGADCGMKWFIEKKINEYNCQSNVILLDQIPREKLIQYYNAATVCIVPSLWENFPYSCLEPMAISKPVIASNTGGIPEIITNNETGILFTPGSSAELAKKIITLLYDDNLREYIGINAAKHIRKICNPKHIANIMVDIYQRLLKCQI